MWYSEHGSLLSSHSRFAPHFQVLMVLDDFGWGDASYHGSDFATPNIDSLSASGIRLERFYVQVSTPLMHMTANIC